jgi:type II secretory ATPase GspE/PulE/Tfp pilus assembly ATPase PilB-like protein
MERGKKITGQVIVPESIFKEIKNLSQFKEKVEEFLTSNATQILESILGGAISLEASDIHIEPEEKEVKLRLRLDGILHDALNFDFKIYHSLLSRIKLLSGLKLNITDRPQDGRFTILMHAKSAPSPSAQEMRKRPSELKEESITIEIRASTLPAEHGESIVLRLLNPKSLIELEKLGLRKDLIEIFEREIKKPNGMIIVTGPTGSGKTTTLYAVLKKINTPEIKIITIEDPIEYHLEGISQTQVDPSKGYDFANGLRSIMRQDPDVILVGEIRDLETAEIACQAALTGHLVFSTLHTNDAAGAVARLVDLGVRPVSIAPAINMVVAQRLPRKVCQDCVKFVEPSKEELEKIKKGLAGIKKEILPKTFFEEKLKIPKAVGCQNCNFTGYRGRVGIFETFLVDDEMERFILTNPSIVDMKNLAIKKGMVLMHQDGLIKVLEGITTIEEVERVAGTE